MSSAKSIIKISEFSTGEFVDCFMLKCRSVLDIKNRFAGILFTIDEGEYKELLRSSKVNICGYIYELISVEEYKKIIKENK